MTEWGISYLEKEYESVLQGKRAEKKFVWTKWQYGERRETISRRQQREQFEADCGSDFQRGVGDILRNAFNGELAKAMLPIQRSYAVAMDPNTGSNLGPWLVSSMILETGENLGGCAGYHYKCLCSWFCRQGGYLNRWLAVRSHFRKSILGRSADSFRGFCSHQFLVLRPMVHALLRQWRLWNTHLAYMVQLAPKYAWDSRIAQIWP